MPRARTPKAAASPDEQARLGIMVKEELESLRETLLELSHLIHANPELGLQERKAAAWCTGLLRRHGWEVETPVAGLETAFRASRGSGRPAVAFLAEYDALPGIGHACGHNIIGASAVGAGLALARVLEAAGLQATLLVDGTPAEETTGGKLPMIDAGLYRDVDAAISMHPDTSDTVGGTCLAVKTLIFAFKGKTAHAASEPDKGVNALDAVILTFNNINALRQHTKPDVRLHGIITHGGLAPNVVPDFARAEFYVRSADVGYHADVLEKVRNCARGAALATGATLEITEDPALLPVKENATLRRLAHEAMADVGIKAEDHSGRCSMGSTDFGNVSQVVPAIAPTFRIAPISTVCHHPDFAAAAGSETGDAAVLAAAKAMALLGLRLVLEPDSLAAAKADFAST